MPAAYLKGPAALPSTNIAYWCQGKEQFESGAVAAEIAARGVAGAHCTSYRCRRCGFWHVGKGRRDARPANGIAAQLIRSH